MSNVKRRRDVGATGTEAAAAAIVLLEPPPPTTPERAPDACTKGDLGDCRDSRDGDARMCDSGVLGDCGGSVADTDEVRGGGVAL